MRNKKYINNNFFFNIFFIFRRVYNIDKRLEFLIYKLLINNTRYLINIKIIILFIFITTVALFIYKASSFIFKFSIIISIRFSPPSLIRKYKNFTKKNYLINNNNYIYNRNRFYFYFYFYYIYFRPRLSLNLYIIIKKENARY